ncbi:POK18 protein, partial [Alcedo cyanopectus]|nr:POK18 protein [Ceyx cyanopectus]
VNVCKHLTSCFAVMGVPQQIKTDNGPAYGCACVRECLTSWGVKHVTGICHSPTDQAIIERTHHT